MIDLGGHKPKNRRRIRVNPYGILLLGIGLVSAGLVILCIIWIVTVMKGMF